MGDTFHLTELGLDSKRTHTRIRSLATSPSLQLPALKSLSPANNVSTKSTSKPSTQWFHDRLSSLPSSTASSQPATPRNKAADRLRRIDYEVKKYAILRQFDDLFGPRRNKLLQKVRSLERSPIVQDEIVMLQAYVTGLRSKYDEMRHERVCKEDILKRGMEQAEIGKVQPQDPAVLEKRVRDLEESLDDAVCRLEEEQSYTKKLEFMKEVRRNRVITSKSPIGLMRNEVRLVSLKLDGVQKTFHRESVHCRALSDTQQYQTKDFLDKQSIHSQTLTRKAEEYRDRSELMEFLTRLEKQKDVRKRLDSNEAALSAYSERIRGMEEAVVAEKELRTNERQAEDYESRLKKLMEVTGAGDFSGIVDYWQYLQANRSGIENNIEDARRKVDRLRNIYQQLNSELKGLTLNLNPLANASLQALKDMQSKNRMSQKALASWHEEVRRT